MAKIKVMGDTVQICSNLTVDVIEKANFYKPEALKLKDEQGNEYFGIGMGDAHYGEHGVVFSSKDHEGKAFMTTANPVTNDHSNRELETKVLTTTFAKIINNLNMVETQVMSAMLEINTIETNTTSAIDFVDETECDCDREQEECND